MRGSLLTIIVACAVACLPAFGAPAHGGEPAQYDLKIDSQPLGKALQEFAKQSGVQVIFFSRVTEGHEAPALKGKYTAAAALQYLLNDSQLTFRELNPRTIEVHPKAAVNLLERAGEHSRDLTALDALGMPASVQSTDSAQVRLAQNDQVSDRSSRNEDQEADQSAVHDTDEQVDLGEVVVTGTRIRGSAPAGSPMIVITREDIEETGYANIPQVLNSLPQSYGGSFQESTSSQLTTNQGASSNFTYGSSANLRGLGNFSTLTLINGRRMPRAGGGGALSDTSMIPLSAIERVEALTDGASAIYGSDAVGGVINFVLRRDFDGAESSVQYGSVADANASEYRLSHTQGWNWSTGYLLATAEYYSRDNLDAAERPFFSDNLTRFDGPDLRNTLSNPGNIARGTTIFGIPTGQDGTSLNPGDLLMTANLQDTKEQFDVLPEQVRTNVYLAVEQQLYPGVRVFGDFAYGIRDFESRLGGITTPLTIQPTHPFYVNPFGGANTPIQVRYSFLDDFGPLTWYGDSEVYAGVVGLDLEFGAAWGGEIYASYGRTEDDWRQRNRFNMFYLNQAVADTNAATTFNPFGDGSNTSDATLDRIRGYSGLFFVNDIWMGGVSLNGPIYPLPADDIMFAVGAEFRRESNVDHTLGFLTTAEPTYTKTRDVTREVKAVYAEVRVPIFGETNRRPAIEELTLSFAGRAEEYSDFGSTTNPKLGLLWRPVHGLSLRSSYGTSFRAPGLGEATSTGRPSVQARPDPSSPTGSTATLVLQGSHPDVGPEEATMWTYGIDLEPESLSGLRSSVTYFSIDYDNRIFNAVQALSSVFTDPAFSTLLTRNPNLADVTAVTNSPEFLGYFGVPPDPTLVMAIADLRIQNLSLETQSGVDIDIDYRFDSEAGDIGVGLAGTWLFDFTQQVTRTAPEREALDTLNAPVDVRLRGRATWAKGSWSAAAFVNYTDDYRNNTVMPNADVRSWTTIDLSARYAATDGLFDGVSISASVQNVFDEDPPFALLTFGTGGIGYDPQQANALGRFISLRVAKEW